MVDAYHIGFHKTATTWFQQVYFNQHPQLCLLNKWNDPWNDEFLRYLIATPIGKFDADIAKQLLQKQLDKKIGREHNRKIIISAERLSGHPYSGGCDRFEIGKRIKQISPETKILIFVRDQVPMLKSLYKQLVSEGYTGHFKDFIYSRNWKKKGFDLSFLEYDIAARFYAETFHWENVFLRRFEDFLGRKQKILFELCDFLDVERLASNEMISKKLGQRTDDRTTSARRILNKFKAGEYVDSPLFVLNPRISNLICRLSKCLRFDVDLDVDDKIFLENYFEASNRRLDGLLYDNVERPR